MTLKDSDILNLPDAPDFISTPPQYSLIEMIKICESMLPYWNAQRYAKPQVYQAREEFTLDEVKFAPDTKLLLK